MAKTSNRELARQLGVSETAVRRAEKAGRIKREADGAWDPAKVKAAWSDNTDQAQQRPPAGARQRNPKRARAEVLSSGGQSEARTTIVVAEVLSSIAEATPPSSGSTRPVVIAIGT